MYKWVKRLLGKSTLRGVGNSCVSCKWHQGCTTGELAGDPSYARCLAPQNRVPDAREDSLCLVDPEFASKPKYLPRFTYCESHRRLWDYEDEDYCGADGSWWVAKESARE